MVLPLLLILPLAAFHVYIVVWVGGLEQARADELTFPKFANTVSTPYGPRACSEWITSASRLESTLPDVATMVIFVVLDCLLKISATESKLPVHYDRDRETVVAGIANALRK